MASRSPVPKPRTSPNLYHPLPAVPSQSDQLAKDVLEADAKLRKLISQVEREHEIRKNVEEKTQEAKLRQLEKEGERALMEMWVWLGVLGVILLIGLVLLIVKMVKSRKEKEMAEEDVRQQSAQQARMATGYGMYGSPQPQMVYASSPVGPTVYSPTYGAAPPTYHPGSQ